MALVTTTLNDSVTLTDLADLDIRVFKELSDIVLMIDTINAYIMQSTLPSVKMFNKVTKYSLWDLATDAIKVRDKDTQQALYEDEMRGQTERYFITAGDLIKDLFLKIEEMFSWKDVNYTETDMLKYLQAEFNATYHNINETNKAVIVNILSEIINAWRTKGTYYSLRWIVFKVFGWEVENSVSLASETFRTNVTTSLFYDSTQEAHKKFYNSLNMTTADRVILVINLFNDTLFEEKRSSFELLLSYWVMPGTLSYKNTPPNLYIQQDTLLIIEKVWPLILNIKCTVQVDVQELDIQPVSPTIVII